MFYQFFTRYVLNDSAAWTEEIARYLLICTVFVGIAAAVRRTRHIHVDFLYRLIPATAGRVLSTLVDVGRIVFFAIAVGLTIQMMPRMGDLQMTIIDLPMNIIYGVCAFGFAAADVPLGAGRDRELAARLQPARAARARDRGDDRVSAVRARPQGRPKAAPPPRGRRAQRAPGGTK